jgi:mono/diheme cytochrome c family protein
MKTGKTISTFILAIIIAACSTTKKNATATAPLSPAPVVVASPPSDSYIFTKSVDGKQAPGNEELAAIQLQYADVTLDKLKEGHAIFTTGACVGCHGPVSIYQYEREQWKPILDDMAQRAELSEAQKDAVHKYILSIKATQVR